MNKFLARDDEWDDSRNFLLDLPRNSDSYYLSPGGGGGTSGDDDSSYHHHHPLARGNPNPNPLTLTLTP